MMIPIGLVWAVSWLSGLLSVSLAWAMPASLARPTEASSTTTPLMATASNSNAFVAPSEDEALSVGTLAWRSRPRQFDACGSPTVGGPDTIARLSTPPETPPEILSQPSSRPWSPFASVLGWLGWRSPQVPEIRVVRQRLAVENASLGPVAAPPSALPFQVWLRSHPIAALPDEQQAQTFAQRLRERFEKGSVAPQEIEPSFVAGLPAVTIAQQPFFSLTEEVASSIQFDRELLAIHWANNLRLALGGEVLPLAEAQIKMHQLRPTGESISGLTSWYGPGFHGRLTANGEIFDENAMTVAHKTLPFNVYLEVENQINGYKAIVRVNDRGPYVGDRILDLSKQAARCLGGEHKGVLLIKGMFYSHPGQPVDGRAKTRRIR